VVERIEEDWALVVGTPDPINHAPGVKMIMSTQGDLLGYSADYNINFNKSGNPSTFTPGGYSIDLCRPTNSTPITSVGPVNTLLNTPGETLTWTQRLRLNNGTLSFSLRNTSSTTWGSTIGKLLSVYTTGCPLADLTGYDPNFSVAQSGPIWWANRVTSLTLNQVRYYDATGLLLSTDTTVRSAYP
jgi:hypothetical protein